MRSQILVAVVLSQLVSWVGLPMAWAVSSYPGAVDSAAKSLYGAGASYTYSCDGCHSGSKAASLPFGVDFINKGMGLYPATATTRYSQSQVNAIVQAIGSVDSDGDSFTNSQELGAGSNPSDPASKPGPACTKANPSLVLNPTSQSGLAGVTLSYSLTLTNKDSSGCAPATFALTSTMPLGLAGSLGLQSAVLSPGQATSISLAVTSGTSVGASTLGFSVKVADASNAAFSTTANGAFVVQAPAPTCLRSTPQMTLSPSSQSGLAGEMRSYQMTLTNLDTNCSASNFQILFAGTGELMGSVSPSALALDAGQSATVVVSVNSAVTTTPGIYNFSTRAQDSAVAEHVIEASGSLTVQAVAPVDTLAPTAPGPVTLVRQRRSAAAVSWSASSDNIAVTKYVVFIDGVQVAETTALKIRLRFDPGIHQVTVRAADAAGNLSVESGPLSITVP